MAPAQNRFSTSGVPSYPHGTYIIILARSFSFRKRGEEAVH